MKKRKITALVMALVLGAVPFSGCGKKETESKYKIYYINEEQGEVLAESFVPSEETTQTIIMSGSLVDGLNMVGRYDGNHMTSVINSVRYTIYSDDLSEEEMSAVLQSMQVVVMK